MKVSIVTLHEANNVGAFLQAFSLQKTIESLVGEGNCSFLRFLSSNKGANSKLKKAVSYLKQGRLGTVLFKYRTAKKYEEALCLLHIDSVPFSVEQEYDTIVVGSDEVWNLGSTKFEHYIQYFAKDITANNIVAYAPSTGNCTAEKMKELGADFSGFHHLSVRDKNAYAAVIEIDGRTPEIVCDPTFLPESFAVHIKPVSQKNYILVYSYGLGRETVRQIKQYARAHKKKLISVGTYNAWCDKNIVVGPIEFLSWLHGADAVITSTFHGTVLSMRLHKKFAVFTQNNQKVKNVLVEMDLSHREVSAPAALADVLEDQIDYNAVEEKILAARKNSMRYLRKALELCEE